MDKNIVIVHYNTPVMTECLVKSINKNVEGVKIYIFDNSDKNPWTGSGVEVIDNTNGQVINFDAWIKGIPGSVGSMACGNGYVSAKHCYSIQKCIEIIDEPFVLMDSDILLKKDVSDLYDESLVWSGEVVKQPGCNVYRIPPFVCWVNVDKMKMYDVDYFDLNYMHGLCRGKNGDYYDTGANFYREAKDLPHKEFKCSEYIEHYGHGSWTKTGYKYNETPSQWLERNKKYWK